MRSRSFRPRLEGLELRLAPAGNVTMLLAGGTLTLTGDRQDNAIAITQSAPGEFTISPDDDATTINGGTDPVTLTRVTRDLRVRLAGGNDRVRLGAIFGGETLVVGRDLLIDGGAGDNAVDVFAALQVARDVIITNQSGHDRTEVRGPLRVGDDFTVLGGDGDNATALAPDFETNAIGGDLRIVNGFGGASNFVADTNIGGSVTFVNGGAKPSAGSTTNFFGASNSFERLTVGGDVTFLTATGPSSNSLTDTDVRDDVMVIGGVIGASTIDIAPGRVEGTVTIGGDVTLLTGGPAEVTLGNRPFGAQGGLSIGGGLGVLTGGADDEVILAEVQVGGAAALATSGGADLVLIDDAVFGKDFALATGGGPDEVRVEDRLTLALEGSTEFRRRVLVDLGSGDDTLQLGVAGDPARVVRLSGPSRFDGGAGSDLLDAAHVKEGSQQVTFVNFERTAPPPAFLGPVRYAVGEYVLGLVTADFNGDGVLDLASANNKDRTVSVLLGHGDGTFAPAVTYDAGRSPHGLAVEDFNGDGRPDLAVTNDFGSGTVSILLNDGAGAFGSRIASPVGTGVAPVQVAAGDVNSDGRVDLVTVHRTGRGAASVGVLLGHGDGTFGAPTVIDLGMVGDGTDVAVGDVNGDNRPDVVATTRGALAVLLGHGDGTFGAPAVEAQTPMTSVVLGDLNRDGKLDLVLGGNDLRVRLGHGDGTFGAPTVLLNEGIGGVSVGDFNRDGIPDVAATHFASPTDAGAVFLGTGDGTFQAPLAFDPGLDDGPVAVGDFDGDGFLDLAVGNQEFASVSVLLNGRKVAG